MQESKPIKSENKCKPVSKPVSNQLPTNHCTPRTELMMLSFSLHIQTAKNK